MVEINKHKGIFKASQKWFANKVDGRDCLSITVYRQVAFDINTNILFINKPFYTLHSDLTLNEEEILKKYSSNYRNAVNRCERDGYLYNSKETIENFLPVYNNFAEQRGIASLTVKKLTDLNENLILTSSSIGGVITAVHSYLVDYDLKIVRLLHSGTRRFSEELDSNMVGRSNKFLHHKDMVRFSKDNFKIYDWGGYAFNTNDSGLQGINKFKKDFGGELIKQKDLYSPLSYFYNLILKLVGR